MLIEIAKQIILEGIGTAAIAKQLCMTAQMSFNEAVDEYSKDNNIKKKELDKEYFSKGVYPNDFDEYFSDILIKNMKQVAKKLKDISVEDFTEIPSYFNKTRCYDDDILYNALQEAYIVLGIMLGFDENIKLEKFNEEKWVQKVDTHWTPPKGTFDDDTPPQKTAEIVCKASDSLKQAVARVNFYFNRCGKKCPDGDERRKKIINILHKLCENK